jgi:hypothetical protein
MNIHRVRSTISSPEHAKSCTLFRKALELPECAITFILDNTISAPQNEEDSNGAGEPQSLDFPLSYAAGPPTFV